jgi:hypothetical protein
VEPCGCPDADRSCCSSACDPKQRHEKSSLPGCCRVAYRVPADDDARRNDRTACADHSDFSSISRSRTPTVDHCGFGLLFHLLSNPTGLPACRMLTPNLPTTIELRLTGQAALQPLTIDRDSTTIKKAASVHDACQQQSTWLLCHRYLPRPIAGCT